MPYVSTDGVFADFSSPMFLDWQTEETEAIKAIFDRVTTAENFVVEWRSQPVGTVGSAEYVSSIVRNCDLVIIGQADPGNVHRDERSLHEQIVRQSGAPTLLVPHRYKMKPLGQNILIGWSNTKESSRATRAATSLAATDAQFNILYVGNDTGDASDNMSQRRDLAMALDRHGFKTELMTLQAEPAGIAETLLHTAFERGCDMVVSGAFGHSRTYDFVIGAVTQDLLRTANVPVLLVK